MHAVLPEAKLIYMVRDPIDRMLSQYLHGRTKGLELRPIEEALADPGLEATTYVAQGRYHLQLSRYLEHYPRESVLVVAQEDLLRNRRRTLRRIFAFLDVDSSF